MAKKLVVLRGLPSSGKSTFSKQEVTERNAIRFTKDDIRKELFPEGWVYNKTNEKLVVDIERQRVKDELEVGREYIIVDNTHLGVNNKHIEFYRCLALTYGYDFQIRDFIVSIEECIKRDKLRPEEDRVGEEVIRKLAKIAGNKGYPSEPIYRQYKEGLPYCLIVDIDGTIAFMDGKRSPYDYSKVGGDRPNHNLIQLITLIRYGHGEIYKKLPELIIVSGRKAECRKETIEWLDTNLQGNKYQLFTRDDGDNRGDDIIKEEIYKKEIENKYNVLAVFDDRERVKNMWRSLGLPCYEVWYGYF